jgi:hypothetical protein
MHSAFLQRQLARMLGAASILLLLIALDACVTRQTNSANEPSISQQQSPDIARDDGDAGSGGYWRENGRCIDGYSDNSCGTKITTLADYCSGFRTLIEYRAPQDCGPLTSRGVDCSPGACMYTGDVCDTQRAARCVPINWSYLKEGHCLNAYANAVCTGEVQASSKDNCTAETYLEYFFGVGINGEETSNCSTRASSLKVNCDAECKEGGFERGLCNRVDDDCDGSGRKAGECECFD